MLGKSKVMVFERREAEMLDLNRMSVPTIGRCEVLLGEERMEKVEVEVFGNSVMQTWRKDK